MELNRTNLSLELNTENSIENTSAKISLGEIFNEKREIIEANLFIAHFNHIPNLILEEDIDCRKANKWFFENYKNQFRHYYFRKRRLKTKSDSELDDTYYILLEDLIVNFDINCSKVRFLFHKTELSKVEEVIEEIKRFKEKKRSQKPSISILISTVDGIGFKSAEISKPKLNIEDNYNSDFKDIHQTIHKRLSKKNDKGLVLLHGKPGTGKTSYIRYLIAALKKEVIFLPPTMATAITNPELISVLISRPNSIFVIEDAENIVTSREKEGISPVSALLNISDGLLSDCLNIQVICSFNTDISKVDSALLRKGRLIAMYEFKDLEVEKAQRLSSKLGFNTKITQSMTLTSVYNQNEKDFQQIKKANPIGFKLMAYSEAEN